MLLLQDYSKSRLDFGDAQFALAIALDNLGMVSAARAVLLYMGYTYIGRFSSEELSLGRRRISRGIESAVKVTKGGKRVAQNVVSATIDYFWVTEIPVASGYCKPNTRSQQASLKELAPTVSRETLYQETMRILFRNSTKKLIVAYMGTAMFRREFTRAAKRVISLTSNGTAGTPSRATLIELLQGFTAFVNKNCSNGSYDNSTANPDGYLLRTNEMGPLEWYRCSDSGEFYSILSRRGQHTGIGGENNTYSIVDTVGIDTAKKESPINFINVCTKINSASRLLFTHKNKGAAIYDIFSHYRDSLQKDIIKKFSQVEVLGCVVEKHSDMVFDIDCSETTVRDKIKGREFICDLFEREFSNGIRKEDIYDRIYLSVLSGTETKTTKNGVRLFATASYTPKSGNLNNSDKLQILVDGYIALFEFLDFLHSGSNTRGITINEMPVEIFRVSDLLKRFKSFEEYVDYWEDVFSLYNEVQSSFGMSKVCVGDIYDNDTVYGMLSKQQLLRGDPVLAKLLESNMSIFTKAVKRHNGDDKNKVLVMQCRQIAQTWKWLNITEKELGGCTADSLEKELISQCGYIIKNYFRQVVFGRSAFIDACDFANVLLAVMEAEGTPVIDSANNYLLTAPTLLAQMGMPDRYAERYGEQWCQKVLLNRALAIQICYCIFVGGKMPSSYSDIDMTWEDFRNFWGIVGILCSYFKQSEKVLAQFSGVSVDSLYLMYVQVASHSDYFKMNNKIADVSELYIFYTNNGLANSIIPAGMASKGMISKKRDVLRKAYNRLMETQAPLCKLSGELLDGMSLMFSKFREEENYDGWTEQVLLDASVSIRSVSLVNADNRKMGQMLVSNFNTDRMGYVVLNSSRYVYNGRVYVHSAGYMVDVGIEGMGNVQILPVSDGVFNDLIVTGRLNTV